MKSPRGRIQAKWKKSDDGLETMTRYGFDVSPQTLRNPCVGLFYFQRFICCTFWLFGGVFVVATFFCHCHCFCVRHLVAVHVRVTRMILIMAMMMTMMINKMVMVMGW